MTKRNADKKKAKRKAKQRARRNTQQAGLRLDKAAYFFSEAQWYLDQHNHDKALQLLRKALKLEPGNSDFMRLLAHLGYAMDDSDIELEGLSRLHQSGGLEDQHLPLLIDLLTRKEKFELALEANDLLLQRLPKMQIAHKRGLRAHAKRNQEYCRYRLQVQQSSRAAFKTPRVSRPKRPAKQKPAEKSSPGLRTSSI